MPTARPEMELETFVKGHTVISAADYRLFMSVTGVTHAVRNGDDIVYNRRDPYWSPSISTFRKCHEYLVGKVEAGEEPTLSDSELLPA